MRKVNKRLLFWMGYIGGAVIANLLLWLAVFPKIAPLYEFFYTLATALTSGYLTLRRYKT